MQRPDPILLTGTAKTLAKGLLAAIALLTVAACATTNVPQEPSIIPDSQALIIPPPGGPGIAKVVSTTFPNAIRQDIWLVTEARTAGENKISVIKFTDKGGDGSDASLKDVPFTQINLTEEALAAWPDTGMAVSPYYVQNNYGPFGYAIGRPANGDTCIYAWQRIEPRLTPGGAVARGTVVVRLQLCRYRASEESLLNVMYRLQMADGVLTPPRASRTIGQIYRPIRPEGVTGFSDVLPVAQPAPTPQRTAPAPAPVQAAAPVATPTVTTTPPVGVPIVPAPTGSGVPAVPKPGTVIVPLPSTSR